MEEVIEISEEEVKALAQSILTRYGIDFTCYEPKSLRRRINRIISVFNCSSVFELWTRLLKDSTFIYSFVNEITVGMTSMFRDPVMWKTLRHQLVKEYANQNTINIWHAGCSSGEEVYTMGIVLQETHLQHKAKAIATDINQDAIAEATRGIYHKMKMTENESNYREYIIYGDFTKYYTSNENSAKMDQKLVSHVNFTYHNVLSDPVLGEFDIIFCRNVMIYFDHKAKEKLMEKFFNALKPGGYFIIGFYDTMLSLVDDKKFSLVDAQAKIFQKKA